MLKKNVLVIHGGAGNSSRIQKKSLERVYENALAYLNGHSALETVIYAVSLLEDDPLFNAGTGSELQRDGRARMSASVMDGFSHRFSGVINIEAVKNPVRVAACLMTEQDRVLSGEFATAFARERGFGVYDPVTAERKEQWLKKKAGKSHGTVGAVALDDQGHLAAATSTGGRGFERVGRVSDSAMPAGNYANQRAAVSCTGIGEQIIEEALAPKICVRIADGMTIQEAFQKSFQELRERNCQIGAIGVDQEGHVVVDHSTPMINVAYLDKSGQFIVKS